jgi:hypothetical protein
LIGIKIGSGTTAQSTNDVAVAAVKQAADLKAKARWQKQAEEEEEQNALFEQMIRGDLAFRAAEAEKQANAEAACQLAARELVEAWQQEAAAKADEQARQEVEAMRRRTEEAEQVRQEEEEAEQARQEEARRWQKKQNLLVQQAARWMA